jgi:iron complex transport system substrate-binding protein
VIPVVIDGIKFDRGFRADLVVNGAVLVELKSLERLPAICGKQVLTYLRLLDLRVGLLINFGVNNLALGIQRFVNEFDPSPNSPLRCNRPA